VEAGLGVSIAPASIARIRLEGIVFRRLDATGLRTRVAVGWHRDHRGPLIDGLLAVLAAGFDAETPAQVVT
jgi:DNA-binding transcriptional LysR family regulator